ncbi:hypothetical protein [Methylomonas sp. MgM2]
MLLNIEEWKLLGAFTHIYDNNFAQQSGISTHYVVLAYQVQVDVNLDLLPLHQHTGYR